MRSTSLQKLVLYPENLAFPGAAMLCHVLFVAMVLMPDLVIGDVASKNEPANLPAAFSLYKEKAELGDVQAQYNVGVMCETGWSVPVDNIKAVRWYRAAAQAGHADAQARLGMMYYLGIGAEQSDIKGQKWIREAAKQNHVLASNIYQKVFSEDVPDTLLPESAIKDVRAAYLKNEKQALLVLDRIVSDAKQRAAREEQQKKDSSIRERRVQRLTEGPVKPGFAPSDDAERIKSVLPGFIGDASLEENRTLARGSVATIRLQAEKGLASAQYNLGRMYELGIKLPVDKQQAFEWYQKSARQAYADAEYRLGIALLYGSGVNQDDVEGRQWLTLAAKHGHAVAKKMVEGMRSRLGLVNISMAANWYIERALAGDPQSAFHLGKLYQHGWGVEADSNEAIKWYQRASSLGFEEAEAALKTMELKSKTSHESVPENNKLQAALAKFSLPAWLAHPAVLAFMIVVLMWGLFFRKGLRKNRSKKQEKIQEI